MAMTKQFVKTQWNNDREPAITAEQLNRMEKGIDVNDTRIVELDEDITAVNNELTSQSKAIGELADKKITKFYASSQGESTLNDSDNGKMQDMMLYGKSEQKQYSGKNLLNATLQTTEKNGVTCTANGDGTYTLNGTATEKTQFVVSVFNIDISKKYKLIGFNEYNIDNICFVQLNKSPWTIYGTTSDNEITISIPENIRFVIHVLKDDTFSDEIVKPMIVDASLYPDITYNDYEPYVGGIPSPNPDYPQEIKSVVEPVVKVTGKNLLNSNLGNSSVNGVTCKANGDGTYTLNGTATANVTFILATNVARYFGTNNSLKLIGLTKTGSYTTFDFRCYIESTGTFYDYGSGTIIPNPKNNKSNIAFVVRKDIKLDNLVLKPMLVADLNATIDDFEPYREQSVTLTGITLNAIPVSSGGNVTIGGQQYISDYVDVERGKIVRMIDSSKLDTTQSIIDKTEWLLATPTEESLSEELTEKLKALQTYYSQTNLFITSNQLDGYAIFNYPISLANGWNYVKQQIGDTRDYIYDMDLQMAQAYVNSEYAVALTELEV